MEGKKINGEKNELNWENLETNGRRRHSDKRGET